MYLYSIGFSAATIIMDLVDWRLIDRVTDQSHEGKVQHRRELQKETNQIGEVLFSVLSSLGLKKYR